MKAVTSKLQPRNPKIREELPSLVTMNLSKILTIDHLRSSFSFEIPQNRFFQQTSLWLKNRNQKMN